MDRTVERWQDMIGKREEDVIRKLQVIVLPALCALPAPARLWPKVAIWLLYNGENTNMIKVSNTQHIILYYILYYYVVLHFNALINCMFSIFCYTQYVRRKYIVRQVLNALHLHYPIIKANLTKARILWNTAQQNLGLAAHKVLFEGYSNWKSSVMCSGQLDLKVTMQSCQWPLN